MAGAALRIEAASVEEVITFNGVAVEFADGKVDTPEAAHREGPADLAASPGGDEPATEAPAAAENDEPEVPREARILDVAVELQIVHKLGDEQRYVLADRNKRLGRGREAALETLRQAPDLVAELEYRASQIRPDWKTRARRPAAAVRPSLNPREFAPGQLPAVNPSFLEGAFRVESFWAAKTGTPAGLFVRAHFHPPDLSTGFEAQHLGSRSELHGVHVRRVDGGPFWLKRLRYRVTANRQMPSKAQSIDGFSNFSVQVLVARSFDPRRSVREQFLALPVGMPLGNDPRLPWQTLEVFGFEFVTEVYIASSASMDIDDIAVVPLGAGR